VAIAYAVARSAKPKDCAKVSGRPWSVTESLGASAGRALRARRCSQESRQCARSARVKTSSVAGVTGDGADMALKAKTTVSQRMTFNHSRRMRQRGQSFHTTEHEEAGKKHFQEEKGKPNMGERAARTPHSPAEASRWKNFLDTANARGSLDNGRCAQRRAPGGSRCAPACALVDTEDDRRDRAASRPVAE